MDCNWSQAHKNCIFVGRYKVDEVTQEEREDCYSATLHITDADATDSRSYYLAVENDKGRDRHAVKLYVNGMLFSPNFSLNMARISNLFGSKYQIRSLPQIYMAMENTAGNFECKLRQRQTVNGWTAWKCFHYVWSYEYVLEIWRLQHLKRKLQNTFIVNSRPPCFRFTFMNIFRQSLTFKSGTCFQNQFVFRAASAEHACKPGRWCPGRLFATDMHLHLRHKSRKVLFLT